MNHEMCQGRPFHDGSRPFGRAGIEGDPVKGVLTASIFQKTSVNIIFSLSAYLYEYQLGQMEPRGLLKILRKGETRLKFNLRW